MPVIYNTHLINMEMQLAAKFIGAGLSTMGLAGIHFSAGFKYLSMQERSFIHFTDIGHSEWITDLPCSTTQRLHKVLILHY